MPQVQLRRFQAMLNDCAKGHWWSDGGRHYRRLHYNGRTYRNFPKLDEFKPRHARKAIQHLGIDEGCAQRHLSVLTN